MSTTSRKRYGLLTEKQYTVLKYRLQGYTQSRIAEILGTARSNVSALERAAMRKIKLAEETLQVFYELNSAGEIVVEPGTHLVDVPGMLLRKADELGVKLRANFTMIYDMLRYMAGQRGIRTSRRIKILIMKDGSIRMVG
ncbi:MAG: Tfx family DNA-binding protein [Thermosphaera sp.]